MWSRLSPKLRRFGREWLRPIVLVLVVVATFRSSVADWNDVPTQSMEPSILVGDRILVNRLAYDLKIPFTTMHLAEWGGPDRGDIIVFYAPGSGTRMVKRVIGVPGDRVSLRRNQLFIGGEPMPLAPSTRASPGAIDLTDPKPHRFMKEQLGSRTHMVMMQPRRRAQRSFAEIVVPRGQYVVMGDNRDNSGDSRTFGFVPREAILGEAFGVGISFDRDAFYRPRWSRFLSGLD